MRNDNISVDQGMQKLTTQPVKDYCYYCGKTGHRFKNQNLRAKLTLTTERHAGITSMKLATVSDSSNRSIAVTSDVSFRGAHGWFNNEQTILDLGGCENLVNTSFAHQNLQLQIQTDTSAAVQHINSTIC